MDSKIIRVENEFVKDGSGNIYPVSPYCIIPLHGFWQASSQDALSEELFEDFQRDINKAISETLGLPLGMLEHKSSNYTETRVQDENSSNVLENLREAFSELRIKFDPELMRKFFKIIELEKELKFTKGKARRKIRRKLKKIVFKK